MKRREFVTLLLAGTAAWPFTARAQQVERIRRIGVLMGLTESDPESQPRVKVLQQGLQSLGWVDGRNVQIEYRWAGSEPGRMQTFAKELVAQQCDVILGHTTPVVAALLRETTTIPIVFVQVSDPLGSGMVASLSRPGGNFTGFSNFEFAIGSKWLNLLKEIAPQVIRVVLLFNPQTAPFAVHYMRSVQAAGPAFSIEAIPIPLNHASEIGPAISAQGREPGLALIAIPDIFTTTHRGLIIASAARHRLPALYPFRYYATEGGLISYGIDNIDLYRRAVPYLNRILRGESPAELPVQQPTKFELVINLKTVRDLGLIVPPTLLAQADEVIE
jgi:putative ABC transport system substrate-binding protein